jgi:predicted XRE-type DNA-binding protein
MKKKTLTKPEPYFTESSGNIFVDLNINKPEEYQLKARLASLIYDSIDAKGWTQQRTAQALSISQPDVSNIRRGLLDHFSVEKLLHFLALLDRRVTITVSGDKLPAQKIVIRKGTSPDQPMSSR